jgi:alpha-amylase/alpha-mannosidase (GH57 family)
MRKWMISHQKYLCIHGHFYQPPRENPWLNQIEFQASALPYHDWNERVTRECYGPNARARLLGEGGRIRAFLNNYQYMSFNFGPTLLSWLEKAHPWIYDQIIAADRLSMDRCQGHGNALAQVYNHIIMPLASRRDKLTQIRWGLADFRHRFSRQAEGMWLAETAVDSETLRLMAEEGVKFTILSPDQAAMVRPLKRSGRPEPWKDVRGGWVDVTRPYRVQLDGPGGNAITVFFYHGPLSRAVAYEQLLASGDKLLARIDSAYNREGNSPELINMATDGESYGHHFKFGDMALSWVFDDLKEGDRITLTNYGEYLERFPPQDEARIIENSAWSCAHGVGRWCSDCGCTVGHKPGWNQAWRAPLRQGMDWLAGELATVFEERGSDLFKDPWKARDAYIAVLLHPSTEDRDRFIDHQSRRSLDRSERIEALQLLESQRMALFMFTSCGWFFDDISGLEATQILRYAGRGIDLVRPWVQEDLEARLIEFLAQAPSNDPAYGNGAVVYREKVTPSRIGPSLAAANYAFAVLGWIAVTAARTGRDAPFEGMVHSDKEISFNAGSMEGIMGEATVIEPGTGFESTRIYLAYHDPEAGFGCMVGKAFEAGDLDRMAKEISKGPSVNGGAGVRTTFERYVRCVRSYTVKDLIPDMRNALVSGMFRWLDQQIGKTIGGRRAESEAFLSLLQETGGPLPEAPNHILSILIADELGKIAGAETENAPIDWTWLDILARQTALQQIKLDDRFMKQTAQSILGSLMATLASSPKPGEIEDIIRFLDMCRKIGVEPDLWECRNSFYDLDQDRTFRRALGAESGQVFDKLGERLGFISG